MILIRRISIILILLGYQTGLTIGQVTVRHDSITSSSLGRTMRLTIVLPHGYQMSHLYPVLLLLHGWNGNCDNWVSLTKLTAYAESYPFIIVMPEGDNSWYVNSALRSADRYEDYMVHDLDTFLQRRYAVDTTWRAIAGLSMGGYGALILGLRHPGHFRFVGALSASLDVPREIDSMEQRGRGALLPSIREAFGTGIAFRDEHDPWLLLNHTSHDTLLYFYLATGVQELFKQRLLLYRAYADSLRARGIPYEYHETPGRHDFTYWDQEIGPLLARLFRLYKGASSPQRH